MLKFLKSAPFSVPLLTAAVYILLSLCGHYITADSVGEDSVFLVIIIIQLVIFVNLVIILLNKKAEVMNVKIVELDQFQQQVQQLVPNVKKVLEEILLVINVKNVQLELIQLQKELDV